ncbi:MAG TPA: penicillin-binding protein activator, partial [Bradyrhizobium sp.]
MAGPHHRTSPPSGTTRRTALGLIVGAPLLTACSGIQQSLSQFSSSNQDLPAGPAGPQQQPQAVGTGQV